MLQTVLALAALVGVIYLTYADIPEEKAVAKKTKSIEDTGIQPQLAQKTFHYSGTNSDKDLFNRPEMLPMQPKRGGLQGKMQMVKDLRTLVATKEQKIATTVTPGAVRDSRIDGVWKPPSDIPRLLPGSFSDLTKHRLYNEITPFTGHIYDVSV
jgi:hypothetical protein